MRFISIYSVLNTLSEYTYFYISKNIIYFIRFCCLFLKSSKAFSVSLTSVFMFLLSNNYIYYLLKTSGNSVWYLLVWQYVIVLSFFVTLYICLKVYDDVKYRIHMQNHFVYTSECICKYLIVFLKIFIVKAVHFYCIFFFFSFFFSIHYLKSIYKITS